MSDLKWEVQLDDQMSAPASAMEARLEALERRLGELDKALAKADKAQTKSAKSAGKEAAARAVAAKETKFQAKSLGEWAGEAKEAAYANKGWLGTLSRTAGAVGAVAAPLMAAGAAFAGVGVAATAASARWLTSSLAFRQDALTGLELLTGSAKEARRVFGEATSIGQMFGMADVDSLRRAREVMAKGFGGEEVGVVFTALADVEARGGNTGAFLDKLGEIRTVGKATESDLKDLAKSAGLELPAVLDRVAKRMGTTRAGIVATMTSPTGLDANEGILGVLGVLSDAGGGKLGRSAERGAQTFTKRLSRIMSAPSSILNSMDFDRFTGFASLNEAAASLVRELEPGSESARRLERAFLAVDTTIGKVFSRWSGPGGAENIKKDLATIAGAIERIAKGAGKLAEVPGAIGELVRPKSMNLRALTPEQGAFVRERLARGEAEPYEPPVRTQLDRFRDWWRGEPEASPTGVTVPPRHVGAPPSSAPLSSAAGPTNNVTITVPITVNGAGSREAGEAIGERLAPDLHAAVLDTLEQLTTQAA